MKKTLLLLFALICMTVNANTSPNKADDVKASVQASYTIIPKNVAVANVNESVSYKWYVKEGDTECSLPTRSLPEGVYQIVLKESGKAMEFRKFEKK